MQLRTVALAAAWGAALAAANGCATAHFARVIGRDNIAAGLTVGGPFTDVGLPVKTPLPVAVGWAKLGTGERTDAYMELGLTTLAFGRFLWGFGGVFQIVEQRGALPGIAAHAGITLLTDFRDARAHGRSRSK